VRFLRKMPQLRLLPNVISSNEGCFAFALRLLKEMPQIRLWPDVINFNAGINSCEKNSPMGACFELVEGDAAVETLARRDQFHEGHGLDPGRLFAAWGIWIVRFLSRVPPGCRLHLL
jgi:hypothetical protein